MDRTVLVIESYDSYGEYTGSKTIKVEKSNVGTKTGWAFSVYFDNRTYPNVTSALYKTKKEAIQKRDEYVENGTLETYGSAE